MATFFPEDKIPGAARVTGVGIFSNMLVDGVMMGLSVNADGHDIRAFHIKGDYLGDSTRATGKLYDRQEAFLRLIKSNKSISLAFSRDRVDWVNIAVNIILPEADDWQLVFFGYSTDSVGYSVQFSDIEIQ